MGSFCWCLWFFTTEITITTASHNKTIAIYSVSQIKTLYKDVTLDKYNSVLWMNEWFFSDCYNNFSFLRWGNISDCVLVCVFWQSPDGSKHWNTVLLLVVPITLFLLIPNESLWEFRKIQCYQSCQAQLQLQLQSEFWVEFYSLISQPPNHPTV